MGRDTSRNETLHLRTTLETKLLAKSAAALCDQDMSEWVREAIRSGAREEMPPEMIDEIAERAAHGDDRPIENGDAAQ